MHIIRPLQLSFNHQVLEQNRRFYFTASASLGVNLQTRGALLDLHYLQDIFECMGENPMPDTGMPKPNGEFLVSGRFYATGNQPVTGGEVGVRLGETEKTLYIFGPRKWIAGLPSTPEPITSLPLDYTAAFGGRDYEKNPEGIGFNDNRLPCIEDPRHLVTAKGDKPSPAGFGPLYPMLPQRMKYQGTYDSNYKNQYFPGYPADHDWRFFLCAPADQWINGYYQGNERFALYHMHPESPVIEGRLPGLYARCFINQKTNGGQTFGELPLNLDTIWFFPDRLIALLIFRGVTEVDDDEAETITHVLGAYEDRFREPRSIDYYREAFEKRRTGDDALLTNLNTQDLIPDYHQSAMTLLMAGALNSGQESEFVNNMEAKSKAVQKMADEKTEDALAQAENSMGRMDIPDDVMATVAEDAGPYGSDTEPSIDLRKIMTQASDAKPDPDTVKLNTALEGIMPGITAGDPEKLDMTNFSFDKIDQIFDAVNEFSAKKEADAREMAKTEIENVTRQTKQQIQEIDRQIEEAVRETGSAASEQVRTLEASKTNLTDNMAAMDGIDLDGTAKSQYPLPRVDTEAIKAQTAQINPRLVEAMQHVQSMKAMGVEDQHISGIEQQVQEMMADSAAQIEEGLQDAGKHFRETYAMSAHFMDPGTSPHKDALQVVRDRFLRAFSAKEPLAGKDWACIDLSGENLDGIDVSGAFLEQVDFRGTSLRGATLKGAILARANLEGADLTGANMADANIGAVHAHRATFTDTNLRSAKLSKGDFSGADFSGADLEGIETLELIINDACFARAHMPQTFFLETAISGAQFKGADMNTCAFIKCDIENTDFTDADMKKCAFVDTRFRGVCFAGGDLSNACFVATEAESPPMENITFRGATLTQANFQNMEMKSAVFAGATLENAFFGGANLSGADLSGAYAKNAQFRKTRLTGAILDDINLMEGSLAKAHLTGASFKRANLYQADFLRSTITDTDFDESNLEYTLIEHWRPK